MPCQLTGTAVHRNDEDVAVAAEKIAGEIIAIFEACNFRDITGQRINKVVKTLRYIEARILAMIDIWGSTPLRVFP